MFLNDWKDFVRTQKRVRIIKGKRAIGVLVIGVLLWVDLHVSCTSFSASDFCCFELLRRLNTTVVFRALAKRETHFVHSWLFFCALRHICKGLLYQERIPLHPPPRPWEEILFLKGRYIFRGQNHLTYLPTLEVYPFSLKNVIKLYKVVFRNKEHTKERKSESRFYQFSSYTAV